MRAFTHILYLLPMLLLMACNNPQAVEESNNAPVREIYDGLFLSAEQINYAEIEYGKISTESLSSDVNARGELVLPVNSLADLVCRYPGVISSIKVREGNRVSKGQAVAMVNSQQFISAQQRYLMVKNELVMLEQEYARQKELNRDKISSDKYYQKAESNYNVANAELKGLELQLEVAGVNLQKLDNGEIIALLPITSPLDGYVEDINVNPGKYIMQDERLMQVVNREHLLVELNVFEKDIMKVRPGQKVSFSLSNLSKEKYEAKIISVGNVVRADNRVVKVLAEFRNENSRMLPGMFVASEIHTGEAEVEALPEEAVVRMGSDGYAIFYTTDKDIGEDGTVFQIVFVETGFTEKNMVEVKLLEVIPEDAMIVVKGGYFLKTELAKQTE